MDMIHLSRGMSLFTGILQYPNIKYRNRSSLAVIFSFLLLLPTHSWAAGPRMGEIYLGVGGGIFAPYFDVNGVKSTALNPPATSELIISLDNSTLLTIPLTGGDSREFGEVQTENLELISLDAVIGYQITDEFSAEIGIDLSLIEIDVEGLHIIRIGDGSPKTLGLQVMPPELLPITFSGVYTFFPRGRISPYIGFGGMLALLDNQRAQSEVNDIIVLNGGIELGYFAHAGVKIDIRKNRYAFFEAKYGRVSSPDVENRLGIEVDIDKFEVRHIKFGLGFPFTL